VDALLRTQPGSQLERGSFDAIAPLSRRCIVNGQRFDVTGSEAFLRSSLAEVAYKASVSATTTAQS
jgi:hypothetical protein